MNPSLTTRWLEREIKPEVQSPEEVEANELLIKASSSVFFPPHLGLSKRFGKWAAMSLYGGGADTVIIHVIQYIETSYD